MAIVCGIDPSLTSAGVAILRDGQPVHVSHHGYSGHNGASYLTRSRRSRWTCHKVSSTILAAIECTPDLVVIEEHPQHVRFSAHEFDRIVLWGGIFARFDSLDVPIVVINNSTAKKWITGRGDAKKPDIVSAVNDWWPNAATNDDEADALGLAAIGAFHLGDPLPFEVKARHTSGLEKVAWPEVAK